MFLHVPKLSNPAQQFMRCVCDKEDVEPVPLNWMKPFSQFRLVRLHTRIRLARALGLEREDVVERVVEQMKAEPGELEHAAMDVSAVDSAAHIYFDNVLVVVGERCWRCVAIPNPALNRCRWLRTKCCAGLDSFGTTTRGSSRQFQVLDDKQQTK